MSTTEKGTLSINTENIFPIIKKFLYSDQEIFLRELVSNAVDATSKLTQLANQGEFSQDIGDTKITVSINEALKTITISDRGIGMTGDEVKKYINQIAFSGATEFIEKFKDADAHKQIIGHFGLGFYSAFMVAKKVEIYTLSYKEGAEAIRWECDGSTEFEITPHVKQERGTEVVIHLMDDCLEFLEKNKIDTMLKKYCKFLPVEIEFNGKVINNPKPLWTKPPIDLKDEDYTQFYKELYPFAEEPLFWIHLNVDYPFNLTGVLYFPRMKKDFSTSQEKIQLYSRQVFITDEVKDIVPEFLTLLRGVIDSPDIPLNVSRSYLQADSNVKKIHTYITKKVGDKLVELSNKNREEFEKKWKDIGLFVKYGMVTDEKFQEKLKDSLLIEDVNEKFYTLKEAQESFGTNQLDKDGNFVILYTNDSEKQHSYIQNAIKQGFTVIKMDSPIDNHFMNHFEMKLEKINWKRVDADILEKLIPKNEERHSVLSTSEEEKIKELFKKVINNNSVTIHLEGMSPEFFPAVITLPEFFRRMKDMSLMMDRSGSKNMPDMFDLSINTNHSVISKILKTETEEEQINIVSQVYDLALLSQNMLLGEKLTAFMERSIKII
ncbi:MAG: molecular chaperone HtpG [Chitinophagaceae bacterium]|nr:molecular chaperone HtpG [Chitinophagaceae bacterium]